MKAACDIQEIQKTTCRSYETIFVAESATTATEFVLQIKSTIIPAAAKNLFPD